MNSEADAILNIQRKALAALESALDDPFDPGSAIAATVAQKAMDVLYKGGMTLQRDNPDALRIIDEGKQLRLQAKQAIDDITRRALLDGAQVIDFKVGSNYGRSD